MLGGFGDCSGVSQHHQHQALLLLEEKLLCLHHITEAELAARAFRDQVAAQEQQKQALQQQPRMPPRTRGSLLTPLIGTRRCSD